MISLVYYVGTAIAAFWAWRLNSLTGGGALAAFIVGAASAAGFGLTGLVVMGSFFLSAVLLEKALKSEEKKENKGSRRDALQVLANGGAPAVCALLAAVYTSPVFFAGFTAAYAAATADTWASTVGKKSGRQPVSIITGVPMEAGISGGVTAIGNAAAAAGSIFVAASAVMLEPAFFTWPVFFIIVLTAFLSQIADAVLGSYCQALFKCPVCGERTEKTVHCGKVPVLIKGSSRWTNDTVNAASVTAAAAAGMLFYFLFTG